MTGSQSIEKALSTLTTVLEAPRRMTVTQLSKELRIPLATAYRHVAALEQFGYLRRHTGNRLDVGATLLEHLQPSKFGRLLKKMSLPIVEELSKNVGTVSQLGVFELDMVTYLIKIEPEGDNIFTRENEQLEAYCSGIGKVLLAGLPNADLVDYLDSGPFPALTGNTITEKSKLEIEFKRIRRQHYAVDAGEIDESLFCLAVPVLNPSGKTIAALSISSQNESILGVGKRKRLGSLRTATRKITQRVYGTRR